MTFQKADPTSRILALTVFGAKHPSALIAKSYPGFSEHYDPQDETTWTREDYLTQPDEQEDEIARAEGEAYAYAATKRFNYHWTAPTLSASLAQLATRKAECEKYTQVEDGQ